MTRLVAPGEYAADMRETWLDRPSRRERKQTSRGCRGRHAFVCASNFSSRTTATRAERLTDSGHRGPGCAQSDCQSVPARDPGPRAAGSAGVPPRRAPPSARVQKPREFVVCLGHFLDMCVQDPLLFAHVLAPLDVPLLIGGALIGQVLHLLAQVFDLLPQGFAPRDIPLLIGALLIGQVWNRWARYCEAQSYRSRILGTPPTTIP